MSKTTITLVIAGTEFTFNVGVSDYNRFINNIGGKNKVAPAHNLCSQTLDEDSDSEALLELLKQPGVPFEIAEALIEKIVPELNITVKKPKSTTKGSTKTP